jgi:hypothetical protein
MSDSMRVRRDEIKAKRERERRNDAPFLFTLSDWPILFKQRYAIGAWRSSDSAKAQRLDAQKKAAFENAASSTGRRHPNPTLSRSGCKISLP